jgi:hypothetical protein
VDSCASASGSHYKKGRCFRGLAELSTHQNFAYWLQLANIYRGWARSASGDTAKGIPCIERGITDLRATGAVLNLPTWLHLAGHTSEALAAIREAEALAERYEIGVCCSQLHRLRGVFLATLGGDETQIEASFRAAINTAKQQKAVSLEKRAEGTYAEYRRQKASGSGGRGFRLPLC